MRGLRLLALIALVTGGCSPAASSTPSAAPLSEPSPVATASASATPSATASTTVVPEPSEVGLSLADWAGSELYLLAGVQPEIRPTCDHAPQLPEGAFAGIQCTPASIGTIGYYLFESVRPMERAYFGRMDEHGVTLDSGPLECVGNKPGEGGDSPGYDGFIDRIGCYVDDDGLANARMMLPRAVPAQWQDNYFGAEVAGQHVYVGVVGTGSSIRVLFGSLFPDYEPGSTGCNLCIRQIWDLETSF
jgi:hypothetical protein